MFSLPLRPIAVGLLVVLSLALGILFWLREKESARLAESTDWARATLDVTRLVGEPFEARADFSAAEAAMAQVAAHPVIRGVVLTKRMGGRPEGADEVPIVPYDLLARATLEGVGWQEGLEGWRRVPLHAGESVLGYLYFRFDRTVLRTINLAILATVLGIGLSSAVFFVREQGARRARPPREFLDHYRELARIDRLALAGYLSAGLLHELKRPVLAIRHHAEDLRGALGDLAGASVGLRGIQQEIERFFERLNRSHLEPFVRSERAGTELVDLNEAIEAALGMIETERGNVRVERRYAQRLARVQASPIRLVQVFATIVLNAYQEMQGQGNLVVETNDLGVMSEVRITDDGPGIDPALIPRIFEPFFSTKPEAEGAGMGLTIAQAIVEELGGKIIVDSQPGGPTTFRVLLPCEAGALRE